MLEDKRILLVVAGGIAAYKTLELIRRLRERGAAVRCILTRAGAEFVTPLSLAAITGDKVYGELFSLTDEAEMGHIELSRDADLLVVAPATADLLSKMAHGLADDLASTALLATDKRVLIAPAMNVRMWHHPATQRNVKLLEEHGVLQVGPNQGDMACGEYGYGRMAEPAEILEAIETALVGAPVPEFKPRLAGFSALVTSGPTHEAIDPVRYIANRSSGRQGHAIASALVRLGAETILVSGPTDLPDPAGAKVVKVQSAQQMFDACRDALPVDIAVCAAAVADWRPLSVSSEKLKKNGATESTLELTTNPDILANLSRPGNDRPRLVIGFAAETEKLLEHAKRKLSEKGCDWILANDVSRESGTFGGHNNQVQLVSANGAEPWSLMSKQQVAERLASRIAEHFKQVKEVRV